MNAADFAAQSWPDSNKNFRRRWSDPPDLQERERHPAGYRMATLENGMERQRAQDNTAQIPSQRDLVAWVRRRCGISELHAIAVTANLPGRAAA